MLFDASRLLGMRASNTGKAAGIILSLLMLSGFAYRSYPGSFVSFVQFDASFMVMLALALPRPRSYTYGFFAIMLFLGFWPKLMLHMLFDLPFLEATGSFTGEPEAWNRALQVASVAAIGVSAARALHLLLASRTRFRFAATSVSVPSWYLRSRRKLWIASAVGAVLINILNFQFAFYQVGVNPRLVLPHHLNVPVSWLVNIGFGLWFAVLIHWELARNPENLVKALLVPMLEGLVSATFALSRSIYLLHTLPYFVVFASKWKRYGKDLRGRRSSALLVCWALCFVASLIFVSLLRIKIFLFDYVPTLLDLSSQTEIMEMSEIARPSNVYAFASDTLASKAVPSSESISDYIVPMMYQTSRLFLNRWIGLEGVLAVSSYSGLGAELFFEGLMPPAEGALSVYQVISQSGYQPSERFTFGSLPGIVGVLAYSGSCIVILIGTLVVTLLMMGTEFLALRFTGNRLFMSILAIGMANVACQIQFPYLSAVFVLQLWCAIAFVWLLSACGASVLFRSPGA
jgi:hypothetical protein